MKNIFQLSNLHHALHSAVKNPHSITIDNTYHRSKATFEPIQSKVIDQITSILAFGFLGFETELSNYASKPTFDERLNQATSSVEVCSGILVNALNEFAECINASEFINVKNIIFDDYDDISWDSDFTLTIGSYEYRFKISVDFPDFSIPPSQVSCKPGVSIDLYEVKVLSDTDPYGDCIKALSQLHSYLVCLFE